MYIYICNALPFCGDGPTCTAEKCSDKGDIAFAVVTERLNRSLFVGGGNSTVVGFVRYRFSRGARADFRFIGESRDLIRNGSRATVEMKRK